MADTLAEIKRDSAPVAAFDHDGEQFTIRFAYPDDRDLRGGDIAFFAALRCEVGPVFFDEGRPGEKDVRQWVEDRYDRDGSQANFIVTGASGERIAFFGLTGIDREAKSAEFGRVMKARTAPNGIMAPAIGALLDWGRSALGLARFDLEVFADNGAAIRLYERCGFEPTGAHRRVASRRGEIICWDKGDGDGARQVIEMRNEAGNG